MSMRCVVCGKEIPRGYICGKCRVEREEVVRIDSFEVIQCPKCGFIKTGKGWKNLQIEDAVGEQIFNSATVVEGFEVEKVSIDISSSTVRFSGRLDGEVVSVVLPFQYKIRTETCTRCSREAGGYYEAILQLRADKRELRECEVELARKVIQEVLAKEIENERAFLTKVEKRREGIDFYFGSRDLGRKISRMIAEELGGKVTESKKLSGRADGRDLYRFTYLVRLPEYEEGDIVFKENRLCAVKNQRNSKGIDIITGKEISVEGGNVIARRSELSRGIVVNADASVAEIMREDGKVLIVPKPFAAEIGDDVYVFEFGGKTFALTKEVYESCSGSKNRG
jgi:nonsense-mediated mRNA decay protein 3